MKRLEQLVGDGALARAAGAGDADDRSADADACRHASAAAPARRSSTTPSSSADSIRAIIRSRRTRLASVEESRRWRGLALRDGALHEVVDHPGQAERHPVVGVVDPLDAVLLKFGDLLRGDRPATAAEDADVLGAALAQHVDDVVEVLDVAALVRADRDPVDVLLDGRAHDVGDAAVVAEVDRPRRRCPGSAGASR